MALHVDQELCISCQSCTVTCPTVFVADETDYKAHVVAGFDEATVSDEVKKTIEEAIALCPVQAIKR